MLTEALLADLLSSLPRLTIGVVGDLFLDRYLDLDARWTEPSLETGLDAYQVTRVRACPGAAGTIVNNLVALGVGRVCPVAILGDDGEGYELRQALAAHKNIDARWVVSTPDRRTPTYTKPMLHEPGHMPRELNRLDIKNRTPLPESLEQTILKAMHELWTEADALLVLDQVSEADCGVISARVRDRLAEQAVADPGKFVLADSRERIGLFRHVCLKPNEREVETLAGADRDLRTVAQRVGRSLFCTRGEQGIRLVDAQHVRDIPGYPVTGPIDIVGAGDSTSAGIACAVAAGLDFASAAAFGNLIASITIQQIGTTGTASPHQVVQRWREVSS